MTTDSTDPVLVDPEDLAAELDDDPDPNLIEDDSAADDYQTFDGPVHGGPWDGRHVQSRYPSGFLLVDRPHQQVWIYDRVADGSFIARGDSPKGLDDGKRWITADQGDYDILVPGAEMGQP
jgi:hypothetical protein